MGFSQDGQQIGLPPLLPPDARSETSAFSQNSQEKQGVAGPQGGGVGSSGGREQLPGDGGQVDSGTSFASRSLQGLESIPSPPIPHLPHQS